MCKKNDKNEIIKLKNRILINNKVEDKITYKSITNENDKEETNSVIDAFFKSVQFEHPDAYYFEKDGKTLYIFEHFEIDCSPRKKKSSLLREKLASVNRDEKAIIENSNEEIIRITSVIEQGYAKKDGDKVTYYINKDGDKYRNNFIKNFSDSFNKHHSQIEKYKEDCYKIINEEVDKTIVVFVVEDITLFGTYYLKDNKRSNKVVNPLFTKQFIEIIQKSNVDYLIFNSLHDCSEFSIIDKRFINEQYINASIDLMKTEFSVIPSGIKTIVAKRM